MQRLPLYDSTRSLFHLLLLSILFLVPQTLSAQSFQLFNTFVGGAPVGTSEATGAWFDMDGDGDLDFINSGFTSPTNATPTLQLFRKQSTFFQKVAVSNLTAIGKGVIRPADFDLDGDIDLLIVGTTSSSFISKLYRNDGSGVFTEDPAYVVDLPTSTTANLSGASADWGDYDNDGDPDLLLAWAGPGTNKTIKLFKNTGTKLDESVAANLDNDFLALGVGNGSIEWGDYNRDGRLDIIAAGETDNGTALTRVLHNDGNDQFSPRFFPFAWVRNGSVQWGDYDQDGWLDVLLTGDSSNVSQTSVPITRVYRNTNGTGFTLVSSNMTGLINGTARWIDYDLDGDLDVLVAGTTGSSRVAHLYTYNSGSGQFVFDAALLPNGLGDDPCIAFGDFDGDRVPDLFVSGQDGSSASNLIRVFNRVQGPISVPAGAPTIVSDLVQGFSVHLDWNPPTGFTNELSYNVYVGTTPMGTDINAPEALLSTGKRQVSIKGEQQISQLQLEGLAPGIYYWSVQGIGNNRVGTAFAVEDSFIIQSGTPSSAVYQAASPFNLLPTGGVNGFIAPADINVDGHLDFLIGGQDISGITANLQAYMNNGSGAFTRSNNSVIPTLVPLRNMTAKWGDANNDNAPDLLICGDAGFPTNSITHLYLNNGSGLLGNNVLTGVPGFKSGSIDWGDYDNDGDQDFVITGAATNFADLLVYQNQLVETGTVSFTLAYDLLPYAVLSGEVKWGDYDRDGDLDLAVTGLRNSVVDGGRFTGVLENTGTGFVLETGNAFPQVQNSSLEWADMNNDGLLDLVITGLQASTRITEIHYALDIGTDFLFYPSPNNFAVFAGIDEGDLEVGDYNDDGWIDIFLTGNNGLGLNGRSSKIYYRSDGAFDPLFVEDPVTSAIFDSLGAGAVAVFGDFSGDEKLDLMFTGANRFNSIQFGYYTNIEPTPNNVPLPPTNLTATLFGFDVRLAWDAPASAGSLPAAITNGYMYNVWLDTVPTHSYIVSPMANRTSGKRYLVNWGNRNGNRSLQIKGLTPGTYTWRVQSIGQDYEGSAFSANGSFTYEDPTFLNQTNATLFPNGVPASFQDASLRWADYDRNGTLDLIAVGKIGSNNYNIRFYNQDISGAFTANTLVTGPLQGVRHGNVDLADVDNDGNLDLLIVGQGPSGPLMNLYENISGGPGAGYQLVNNNPAFIGIENGEGHFADYDNDGWVDMLVVGESSSGDNLLLYHNESSPGNISFSLDPVSSTLNHFGHSSAAWGDFNNDGWLDFAVMGEDGGTQSKGVYFNDRNGGFTFLALGQGMSAGTVDAGDYDADGFLDLVFTGDANGSPLTQVWHNNQNGTFTLFTTLAAVRYGAARFGDYTQDGYSDLILVGESSASLSATVQLYAFEENLNQFVSQSNAVQAFMPVGLNSDVVWGDFTGDGKLDLAIAGNPGSANTGSLQFYENIIDSLHISAPTPLNPKVSYVGNEVLFSWDVPAYALETAGLSYNFYVGTTANGVDIRSPEAFTSGANAGLRQVVKGGTVRDTTRFRMKDLPTGTYFWGVQSITADYEGSAWATHSFSYEPPSFVPVTASLFPSLPEGLRFMAMDWGDFDNDNDLDLLVSGETAAGIPQTRLYRNLGSSFDTLALALPQLAEGTVRWVDMDENNHLDFFLSGRNSSGNAATYLFRNNGNSTFTNLNPGLAAVYQSDVDWGDFDYDGDMDLVLMGNTGTGPVSKYYRNNGNNTFTEQNLGLSQVARGAVRWFDYNEDSFLDLVLTGELGNSQPFTSVYQNNGTDSLLNLGNLGLPALKQGSLAVADMDLDGDADIALAGLNSLNNPVAQVFSHQGANFVSVSNLSALSQGSLAWGDYDDNGYPDLVQTGRTGASGSGTDSTAIYRNNGAGSFTQAYFAALPLQAVGQGSMARWADFDRDGKLDLALGGRTNSGPLTTALYWYQNIDTTHTNILAGIPTALSDTIVGDTVILTWAPPVGYPVQNGNGLTYQLVVGTSAGNGSVLNPHATIGTGPTSGIRKIARMGPLHTLTWKLSGLPNGTYFWSVQAIDTDLEGSPFPAAQTFTYTAPAFVNVNAQWNPGGQVPGAKDGILTLVDYNNDDQLDLFYMGAANVGNTGGFYVQNASGAFVIDPQNQTALAATLTQSAAAWGDVNRDGRIDVLVIGQNSSGTLRRDFYLNSGSGFSLQTTRFANVPALNRGALDFADYDKDGDLDLAIMGNTNAFGAPSGYTRIFENVNGIFQERNFALPNLYDGDLEWGDFDQDGDPDLLISGNNGSGGLSAVYVNGGRENPGFTQLTTALLPDLRNSSVAWGDAYNRDGFLDILLTGQNGTTQAGVYQYNNGSNSFSLIQSLNGVQSGQILWGDYTNDGYNDILLTGRDGNNARQTYLYFRQGNSYQLEVTTSDYLKQTFGGRLAWGDVDQDGKLDFVQMGEVRGSGLRSDLTFYRNATTGTPTATPVVTGVNTQPQADSIRVSWSSAGPEYTYNLYVGTSPQGQNKKAAESNPANGYRRMVFRGNVGHNTDFVLHDLTETTYFWAVQAVSADLKGGPFSVESSFTYVQPHFLDVSARVFPDGLPEGLENAALAWADQDLDGDLDFVATGANLSQSANTWFFRNENGQFTLDNTLTGNLEAIAEGDLEWADFDHDGDPDLLLTGRKSDNNGFATIYRNDITQFVALAVGFTAVSQSDGAWGDLNNDGWEDLVLIGDSAGFPVTQFWLNDKVGAFTRVSVAGIPALRDGAVELADLNQDQLVDMLLSGEDGSAPFSEIYLNGGVMTFAPLGGNVLPAVSKSSIAVGEFNQDEFPDLIITGIGQGGLPVTALLLNDSGTSFTNATPPAFPTIGNGSVRLADYNEDNFLDVIFTGQFSGSVNSRTTQVFAGAGTGNFVADNEATDPFLPMNIGSAAAFGDYNGDGKLDLLVAGRHGNGPSQTLQLFQNVEGTPNQVPSPPGKPEVTATGIFARFQWSPSPDLNTSAYTYNLYLRKLSDGSVIVAPLAEPSTGYRQVVGPGNAGFDTVMTVLGLEFGDYSCQIQAIGPDWEGSFFSDTVNFPFEPTAFTDSTGEVFAGGIPTGLLQGDISFVDYYNSDDQLDLVLTGRDINGPRTELYRNLNGVLLQDLNSNLPGLEHSSLAWGDMNLDGKVDLYLMGKDVNGENRSLIFLNRGESLREESTLTDDLIPLSHGAAAWGDLDNDGDMDLVMSGEDDNGDPQTVVYFNEGGTALVLAGSETLGSLDKLRNSALVLVDYNQDGRLDIILSGRGITGPITRAYANQGDSTFVPNGTALQAVEDGSLDVSDFDNDGNIDLLISGASTLPITEIWSYEPIGGLFTRHPVSDDLVPVSDGEVRFGDYQNDGWPDILLSGRMANGLPSTRLLQNYENNGNRRFQNAFTSTDELFDVDLSAIAWGDFNGDQKLDVILMGDSSSTAASAPVIGLYTNVDTVANVRPNVVQSPTRTVNDTLLSVFFNWETPNPPVGRDAQVSAGYQYNLYLVNKNTGDTVISPLSSADGYRRVVENGPIRGNKWQIRGLEDGAYEWGVQSVDQDFEGSAWLRGEDFTYQNPVPVIVWEDYPERYVKGTTLSKARIGVNDRRIVRHVFVHYKGISAKDWLQAELFSNDSIFTFDITVDLVDEIGLRYWFEVEGISIFDDSSTTGHTYVRHPDGLNITGLDFGKKVQDYNIIAIPLELDDSSIANVIENDPGFVPYNKRQWRFWEMANEEHIEYKEGLENLNFGRGYWLITKEERSFNSGPGETVQVTEESPYAWNLQQGWNLVGNPYDFRLWWPDIVAANPSVIGQVNTVLVARDGLSFVEDLGGNTLNNKRGLLIQANSAVQLKVPVRKNTDINRLSKPMPTQPIGPIDGQDWLVPLRLVSAGTTYQLGGIGMHPEADSSRDLRDRLNPPRLTDYLEMNFFHPEYFYPWFSRDIVPSAENHVWEFSVESNLKAEEIVLEWDNSAFGQNMQQMILFDVARQLPVDMRSQNQYRSWSTESVRQFRIYYGSFSFLESHLQADVISLGQAYPNPADGPVIIPFALPPSPVDYGVGVEIRDLTGRLVRQLPEQTLSPGFQEWKWDGKGSSGNRLPAGIYLYYLEVSHQQKTTRLGGRVVLR